ncbi:hypothetical protein SCP_1800540 [Sparassis crispa]|uniref:Uncharacterized protein n=1 Tax=Sparassis crispa TaxID=139825 RepID=A0A401H6J0_9APHY|nr:hypothetical protein SCP_1800540 [Sparassis crispa]GBE90032.1 hypothetical protein SCP_1800540 [Sparassis crispa]
MKAGCAGDKIKYAITACGQAFGIKVARGISRRTAGRAKQEAGVYGLMQLGREISNAPAFGESTDGTTHRKITYEARHITLAVPSYAPGVDDSDKSTWTFRTRFAEVAPVLDHTAQRQFKGSQQLAEKISQTYSNSPLATREGQSMETDNWIRKQVMQNMDHAVDRKKKFKLCQDWKEDVTRRDLGRERMDVLSSAELVTAICSISADDICQVAGDATELSLEEKSKIRLRLLERQLGDISFNELPSTQQRLIDLFIFSGCCGHKDLNAFKYGVVAMGMKWENMELPLPVLLANKANDAVIKLGQNADSAAVQRAMDSSAHGGVKLTAFAGALFRHKNDDTGDQD